MTLIMSAGMAQPNGEAQKKLNALVENGRNGRPAHITAPAAAPASRTASVGSGG
jgi:hypothetical protein